MTAACALFGVSREPSCRSPSTSKSSRCETTPGARRRVRLGSHGCAGCSPGAGDCTSGVPRTVAPSTAPDPVTTDVDRDAHHDPPSLGVEAAELNRGRGGQTDHAGGRTERGGW